MIIPRWKYLFINSCLLLMSFLTACQKPAEQVTQPKQPLVKLYQVEAASRRIELSLPAIMKAGKESELAFTSAGVIKSLPVIRGQEVAQGDLIARLDDRDFKSNLASARAQYKSAQADYRRAESLKRQGAISQRNLDQSLASRDVARANLERMRKAVNDSAIYAPFAGNISEINVEAFQRVNSGQVIVRLQDRENLVAAVDIPASILIHRRRFKPTDTSVTLEALPDQPIPATFVEASGQPDAGTQTYEARFSFKAPESLLVLPGMTGTLKSTLLLADDVPLVQGTQVPVAAVSKDTQGTFVWVVDPKTMRVSRRAVTVGEGMADNIRLSEGLQSGDLVVAAGVSYLAEGMVVRAYESGYQP